MICCINSDDEKKFFITISPLSSSRYTAIKCDNLICNSNTKVLNNCFCVTKTMNETPLTMFRRPFSEKKVLSDWIEALPLIGLDFKYFGIDFLVFLILFNFEIDKNYHEFIF